ncbi:UNVERIFIED_CONTAM: hypothetical protein FKN15_004187 [Acipenser sinensis]
MLWKRARLNGSAGLSSTGPTGGAVITTRTQGPLVLTNSSWSSQLQIKQSPECELRWHTRPLPQRLMLLIFSPLSPLPHYPLPFPQLSPGSEDDDGHEGTGRENLGRIQFSVGYNFQDSTLTVKILKGQELPAKDFSGTSDPFVKIYLLPDKKNKLETKVKRKNLNPHWNETFLFEGVFAKCRYVYYGKHSEGNRFIRDEQL